LEDSLFNKEYLEFDYILNKKKVNTVFQPIISLEDCSVLGYEALSRGPENSYMNSPQVLIAASGKYNKEWELEELFSRKALEKFSKVNTIGKIFLNVSPKILHGIEFKNSFSKESLNKYSLKCEDIIFEVTEKDAVINIEDFKRSLEHYRMQNYEIAIDDSGTGYSGLNRLCEIKPKYIKLDIELISNIDKDETKIAIVKSMQEFCSLSGSNLIALGIESEEELKTLIEIGVQYGQGYFIQKPNEHILPIEDKILEIMNNYNNKLCVDYKTSINNIIDLAMSRKKGKLYDNVILTRDSKYYGVTTIKDLIVKSLLI
jgi:EAL domain-containing protein (putative c-di-GMP-specific phosphodiesterase class I)